MPLQGVDVALQACDPEPLSFELLAHFSIRPKQIISGELRVMHLSSLILDYELQVLELLLLQFQLLPQSTGLYLQVIDLLGHELLILF